MDTSHSQGWYRRRSSCAYMGAALHAACAHVRLGKHCTNAVCMITDSTLVSAWLPGPGMHVHSPCQHIIRHSDEPVSRCAVALAYLLEMLDRPRENIPSRFRKMGFPCNGPPSKFTTRARGRANLEGPATPPHGCGIPGRDSHVEIQEKKQQQLGCVACSYLTQHMQRLRCTRALVGEAMKMAAQSLLQETNVLGCGARRALWNGSSRMVFARPHSSVGSVAVVTAGPEQRVLRFGVGRLPYCSQLSVASEGGRKVSTGAAAVRCTIHIPRYASSSR